MKIANKDEKKAILDGLIGLFGQNRRWVLFFGTGTSCALDNRFGMPALQGHLSTELAAEPEWARVEAELKAGKTLEQALTGIGLSQATKAMFRQVTGDFVASIDRIFRDDLLMGRKQWVGTRLLKTLVCRLPARNPRLSVITSNYDMLIEYACSVQRIRWTTGFVGGLTRVWNWEMAQDGLNQCQVSRAGARSIVLTNPLPRVELFKVHGSINRFTVDSQQVECDLWTYGVPAGLERDVAVPGDLKYEQYAVSNMDTVSHAVRVEDEAPAFAVIGYGFNDPHLHQRILARVQKQDCPLVVMTLDLEEAEIARLREVGSRVWLLVASKLPGGESDVSRTVVYMPGHVYPYVLDGEQLWVCDSFAERILGG
jgi:hypothetical protein